MGKEVWPVAIRQSFDIEEWRHASAILHTDFRREFDDIVDVLTNFKLLRSEVVAAGKNKSPISRRIDQVFYSRGWVERSFDTKIVVDGEERDSPTHKVDCYRNGVAFEIEWNNKDPFYDRDLSNFRLLFDLRVISVGIILTRATSLQRIFDKLGKGKSYGNSTTHMNKLLPRIQGGGGGGCPIIAFAISDRLYVEDVVPAPEVLRAIAAELPDEEGSDGEA